MKEYSLSDAAKADIRDIWEWIAAENPSAATKLTREILDTCAHMVSHPLTGSQRPDFTGKPLRFMLVRRIIFIVYDPATWPLEIIRVLHTSRDIYSVLAEDS